jgi:hypothetical protein
MKTMIIAVIAVLALAVSNVPGYAFTQGFDTYGAGSGLGNGGAEWLQTSSISFTDFTLSSTGSLLQLDAPGYYGATNYEFTALSNLTINFNTAQSNFIIGLRDFSGYGGTETITVYGADDTTVLSTYTLGLNGSITSFSDLYENGPIGAVTLSAISGESWTGILQDVAGVTSAPVPEPGTMALLGIGMAGLALYGKRRQNNKA